MTSPEQEVTHGKIIPAGYVQEYLYFPVVCLGIFVGAKLHKVRLNGRWSSHLDMNVLAKIRFDFSTPDKLSLQEMKSNYQALLSSS